MAIPILMPALSPTMEAGRLARWLVKEGDAISAGDVIAEIETDKALMEMEAVDEGVLGRIAVAEGTDGVKINTPIAVLLEGGEAAGAIEAALEKVAAAPAVISAPSVAPSSLKTEISPPPAAPAKGASRPAGLGRIFASPLARRLAREAGVELSTLQGSGPYGRIIRRDVEQAPASTLPPAAMAQAPMAVSADAASVMSLYEEGSYDAIPLDSMRTTVARRLTEAKQTIPHFYLTIDVAMDALLAARARANTYLADRGGKLSVNDYVIKAVALALRDVPDCNVAFAQDRILRFHQCDISIAVAIEGGLITPVIRHAENKSLTALSAEMKDLAARARARKLAPHEYQGGSFTISNLGMFGVRNFDAVINPPQGAILALGASEARAVVVDGEIRKAMMMTTTMSVDHRAIDGALGAKFLQVLRSYLEDPSLMAV